MDQIMGFIMGIVWLPILLVVLVLGLLGYFVVKSRYKAADADKALVISGGRKGIRIFKSGGSFVNPFHKFSYFSLLVRTVRSGNQEAQTKTHVPVLVEWTAQIRPDTTNDEQLRKAIEGFIGYASDEVTNALQQTLDGEIRAVVATMTPEAVVQDKETFSTNVTANAKERMRELGFDLVNLNIAEVSDKNGYFGDLAAEDREAKRRKAANIKAESDRDVRVVGANANQTAKDAEIAAQLITDERERDAAIKRADYKAQRDTAEADAEIAGELQRTKRAQEVAANRGAVAVVEAEQDEKAAAAQRAAALTRAETERQKDVITAQSQKDQDEIAAQADARRAEIEAEAKANVAKRNAEGVAQAEEARAKGVANAKRATAEADADAINLTADAEADKVRKTGLAEAEVERAKGEADAAAILARGKAEAEAERELAEARAAHGGVNKEIEIAKIEASARVEIATAYGTAMHEVGKNVTILQTGGSGANGGGNLLTNLLGGLPGLAKELDIQSGVLNGTSFNDVLAGLVNAVKGNAPAVATADDSVDELQS